MVVRTILLLIVATLGAQELNITSVSPTDSDKLALAYTKYQRAKKEFVKVAGGVAKEVGFDCPVFSKDFHFVLNDPSCEEDSPVVKDLPEPKKVDNQTNWYAAIPVTTPLLPANK